MSAHSLRARLGSLYILCGHGWAHLTCQLGSIAALGLNAPHKNIIKPIEFAMYDGFRREVHREVPHSLRARSGTLNAWAPLDLCGCTLGTSDTHEKHTSGKSASYPGIHTLPHVRT